MSERNNVLLVILDSVRAENTSLHGYDRETTPFLSAFADRSTVYTQARAPGIHSIASHVSMFTGAHVEEHEAFEHTAQIDVDRTIWRELQTEYGYETGLFTNNRIVSNASNLGAAFEYKHEPAYPLAERLENKIDGSALERVYFRWYDAVSRLTGRLDSLPTGPLGRLYGGVTRQAGRLTGDTDDSQGPDSGYKTLYGKAFTDAFLDWEADRDGPWAACLNLMDTHSPYEPKAEFDAWADEENWRIQREDKPSVWETLNGTGWDRLEALEALYDGTILQADAILEDLIDQMESRGLLDDTLVVITSDHGEAFGEHSRLVDGVRVQDHKWSVHEVLTHVPFVVNYPEQDDGRVVDSVVSLTDTPALLRTAAADAATDDPLTERDTVLTSTFRLPEAKIPKYSSIDDIETYVGPWRAVYEDDDGTVRKYAQKDDHFVTVDIDAPGEATVVSTEEHDRVATAYDSLTDSDVLTEQRTEIDENLEEQLEDLGYIR
ncbi:Arylsulfatase A [Halovenus aranensis]|uniref:Arylsulfatase A n=1 Tax=Halovenus aranensis TaxID=890420 RepID=A0A1G8TPR4_9EURY|nr:sulfatase-like hydrolase/transferase [Halovenus aranensis]SDJ43529.1 Arylsulfatase A [Halovenus aranensis]